MGSIKRNLLILSTVLLLFLSELQFGYIEICIGELLVLTNDMRMRYGMLWEIDTEMRDARETVSSLADSIGIEDAIIDNIHSFYDVYAILRDKNELLIPFEKFMEIYMNSGRKNAAQIIDPLLMLQLMESRNVRKCFIRRKNDSIILYFLDVSNMPVTRSVIPPRAAISRGALSGTTGEYEEKNSSVSIPPRDFFLAFNALPEDVKKQIINDPYRLILIRDDILRVFISREITNGTNKITFDFMENQQIKRIHFFGRDVAVGFLIQKLNELKSGL